MKLLKEFFWIFETNKLIDSIKQLSKVEQDKVSVAPLKGTLIRSVLWRIFECECVPFPFYLA